MSHLAGADGGMTLELVVVATKRVLAVGSSLERQAYRCDGFKSRKSNSHLVGADGGGDAGAGGSGQNKGSLSLVVASSGKTSKAMVAEDRGGAQVKGGALTKVELWSRSSGDDKALLKWSSGEG